jgi:hypothetical protein
MVKHVCTGGGAPIHTNSGYTDYSTGNGGSAPKYGKHGSTNSIQHRLQAPIGERTPFASDKVAAKGGPGGQFPFKPGKHEVAHVTAPRGAKSPYDPGTPRGIPNKNDFNPGFSRIGDGGGNAKNDRGVSYKDGEGRTKYRGKSG